MTNFLQLKEEEKNIYIYIYMINFVNNNTKLKIEGKFATNTNHGNVLLFDLF